MILVAAAAVGALGYRLNDMAMTEHNWERQIDDVDDWAILGGPGLGALTTGLVVVRLLPPRAARCALFRQPGFTAGCVAIVVTAERFIEYRLLDWLIQFDDWLLAAEWVGAIKEVSLCILVVWPVLALAGCLRAERSWIDRALRAVAFVWVRAGIALQLVPAIQFWLDNR
jgi:hypothetical protein